MSAVCLPGLPQRRVTALAIGERYSARLAAPLSRLGIEAVWLPDNPALDVRLAAHADMNALCTGPGELIIARELWANDGVMNALADMGIYISPAAGALGPVYPGDVGLNACLFGARAIYNPRTADAAVLRAVAGLECIPVRQGYAKCSVCVVDESAVITADTGVARAAECAGLAVLQITPGHITLEGYGAGFIGGAAFKLSKSELAFTGRLDAHPDAARILDFLAARGVSPVFLTQNPLEDVGGAVALA